MGFSICIKYSFTRKWKIVPLPFFIAVSKLILKSQYRFGVAAVFPFVGMELASMKLLPAPILVLVISLSIACLCRWQNLLLIP